MVISFKKILILFIIYQLCYLKESFFYNYDEEVPSNHSPQLIQNEQIVYYLQIFPIAYLAYIINNFIPFIPDSPNITDLFNNINYTNYTDNVLVNILMNTQCFNFYLRNYYSSNQTEKKNMLFDTIRYSGKTYPDFGDEEGCIANNKSFLLICINLDLKSPGDYKGKYQILPFISKGFSFYGLCIDNQYNCTEGLVNELSPYINYFKSLNNTFDVNVFINHRDKSKDLKYPKREIVNKVITGIILTYVLMRIIIAIFGLSFFKEDDLEKKKSSDSDSSSDEEEEEEENDSQNNKKDNKEENKNMLIEKNDNNKVLNKDKYPKLYFFYLLCSIKLSFRNLLRFNGILYNETDLYLIIFFKTLSLLLKTLYMINYLMIFTPSKEMNNISFFNSYFIYFIRYSSFTDIIFIMTESILVSYKLMSFIRKYTDKNEEPSFKLFNNFFLRIIPSFIIIYFYFFKLYFFSEGMMFMLLAKDANKTRMMHFRENLINCHTCVNNAKALIPFYIQYQNFVENISDNTECFHFMILMTNLFYCYLFVILLTYVSYKIKNSKFDKIIVIAFLIYFFVPINFLCKAHFNNYFNIHFLFGERYTVKYTHIFMKFYFYGFLIGLSLFYNNDITHEKSLQNSSIYKPFYFLRDIIGYIFLMKFWVKILIIVLTIVFQIALSFSFFLYSTSDFSSYIKTKKMNLFDHFLHLNEKNIFSLIFGIMITILYTFKNEPFIKGITNNIIIILFNRVGYGYYALIEIMINYMYCYIELEIQLNSINILFVTLGIIFYILILNILFIILFEIPAKILMKKLLKKEADEKQILLI